MPARTRWASILLLGLVSLLGYAAPSMAQADPCAPLVNPVACENSKPGTPRSQWEIYKAGDETIQGFATAMSVNRGEQISFKIKSETPNYRVSILRLGYYGGDGARMIASNLVPTNTTPQPACISDESTGLIDCGNWHTSLTWTVPSNAVSGVYIALLKRLDTGGDSHITFVVRDDSRPSDIVLQTSDATWQAYNTYGGNSLYTCNDPCPPGNPKTYKSAFAVSYNRPLNTAADDSGRSALLSGGEYPLIRFLEKNGYDVSYISQVDTHANPSLLLKHKLFISSGHDEYWSAEQRRAMEQARDAGVNLAFFTGNTGFWKTRYAPSIAGSATPNRTLISYKDTHFPEQVDPVTWTGTWRDGRFASPADNVTPENALTGGSFLVNSGTTRITVPAEFGKLRMWRNTAAATLAPGTHLTLAPDTLGYEWDVDADNGFRPPGNIRLSETTASDLEIFMDYGSTVETGHTATHHITMYKAPSGARVFNTNTVQWSWGLDSWNPNDSPPDRNMQQATVNILADLDAQPGTLASNLTPASKTTDTTPPSATLNTPPASVDDGTYVTLSGTATDGGGGRVAGVEISTDGGETWHPVDSGTTDWTYKWFAHGHPSATIKVRATDDSGNIGPATAGKSVAVNCPCSLWGGKITPPVADGGDPSPIEVGMKFRTETYGKVTGMRFYKAAANTGTHVGSLWNSSGERLAQATFTNETASGWQTVSFDPPVDVLPGETYTVSYYAPNGHYTATTDYFYRSPAPGPNGGAITESGPLKAVRNTGTSESTTSNGVYAYGATSAFPANSFGASNYWVDPIFVPHPLPGAVTNVTATEGGFTSANVTWSAPSSGGPVTGYRITPYVNGVAQTPRTVTGSPPETSATITGLTQGTTYTFRVEAVNPNGSGPASPASNPVTPSGPVAPSQPLSVSAKPASTQAQVSWSPPAGDGDSAISGYTVTPYVGTTPQTPVEVGPSARSVTVTGLINGVTYTFRVTATNGVGTSPPSSPSNPVTPQATIFDFQTPAVPDSGDNSPVEVGVKFRAEHSGAITGLRFYKADANSGTHVGTLWNEDGTPLRRVTFTNESESGWQTALFDSPYPVTAGTTYIASYFAPSGHYSATAGGLQSGAENGLLTALANSTSPNGVYAYSSTSTFPTNSYNGANYWVDVLYDVPVPGQVTNVSASPGGLTSANLTWSAPSSGGPVKGYRVTPYIGSTPQTPRTINSTETSATITGLTNGTTYTFKVQAFNDSGLGAASAASNAVTPLTAVAPSAPTDVVARPATSSARVTWKASASDGDAEITAYTVTPYVGGEAQTPVEVDGSTTTATVTGLSNGTTYTFRVTATNSAGTSPPSSPSSPVTPQYTIFDFGAPSILEASENDPVELGVKFRTSFPGTVTGIRFYKGEGNTGTHIGNLWTADGTRLASVTFTNETASGWQTALFSNPVSITPGTTYIASYFAPRGHYSSTGAGFATAVTNGPLTALANGTSSNGVFAYSSESTFPTSSFNAANYWVDVLFAPAGPPGQVTGVTGTPGQASVQLSWNAPSTGGPVTSYRITPYIGSTAQEPVEVTGSPPPTTRTVTGLTPGIAYTFRVEAVNMSGSGAPSSPSAPITPLGATEPGAPVDVSAEADSTSALVSWSAPTNDGGSAITGYTVTPYVGEDAQTPTDVGPTVTRTRITGLTNGTAYTFRVRAKNAVGTGPASAPTSAVTPRASLFELTSPGVPDSGDTDSVVLGVKFATDVPGTVTGLRFFKSAANTGTHVGTLYTADGQVLAQGEFENETASGWQTLTFENPVTVIPGTTYVAAYLAPNGHYAVTGGAFSSGPIANPPLRALDSDTSPNGVFAYSNTPVFPTSSWNSTNYWVDVLFAPAS